MKHAIKMIRCVVMPTLISMFSFTIVNAQIVYTDVNPDVTTSGTYNLDLNNDGTIDFVIAHTSIPVKGTGKCKKQKANDEYIKVTPLNGNQVLDTGINARMLALNQTIDASVTIWGSSIDQILYTGEHKCAQFCVWGYCSYNFYPFGTGEWAPGVEDGFLGLRLIYGGHSYFGWVRIGISPWTNGSVNGFTPKDYAFNSQPDKAILAGQSSTRYLGLNPLPDLNVHFCAGNNIPVPYVIAGSFSAGNIVTAQLSDATGSFANPVAVGNVVSKASGTINALVPALTPSGDGYRMRVVSSDPVRTSISVPLNAQVHGGLPEPLIGTLYAPYLCENPNVYLAVSPHESSAEVCYSYQWKLNGNPIPGATSQFYTATEVGNYTCVISNAAGTVTSNVITISLERPAVIISNSGSETVTLSNIGAQGFFQWKLNGNDIPNATAQNYVATVSGDYACTVTNSCGAFISNTISVTIYTAKQSTSNNVESSVLNEMRLKIAPNPVSSSTTISFSLPQSERVSIKIFDMSGRLIATLAETAFAAGQHQLKWDVGNVKTGVYVMRLQAGNYTETRKLVVAK
jgi:hypothetical protein